MDILLLETGRGITDSSEQIETTSEAIEREYNEGKKFWELILMEFL